MTDLQKLIALAKAEEGYIEKASNKNLDSKTENRGDNNYTKYSRDINAVGLMGCQAQPWCCSHQFWLDLKIFGKESALKLWHMTPSSYVGYNCFATYNIFAKFGKVGKVPKIGALVIFSFSHAGRVLDVYKINGITYFDCEEGNTSSNLNDRNGGMVKIRRRAANDPTIKGFCYIDYNTTDSSNSISEQPKSGWVKQEDGWHFYLGDTGKEVKNDWYLDCNGKWAWFNAAGVAISNTWYQYKNHWYYFGADCYALQSEWILYKDKYYYLTADGSMAVNAWIKSKDAGNDFYYFVGEDGIWDNTRSTFHPKDYPVTI